MKTLMALVIGATCLVGAQASAQPYRHDQAPAERHMDRRDHGGWGMRHHRHRVCHMRHHHRVCRWR